MNTITQRVLNSRTFTNLLATFVKQRLDNTADDWRLNAKERTHHEEKQHLVAPPSLLDTPSSKDLQDLASRKLERGHSRKQRTTSQKVESDRNVPSFSTSSRALKVRTVDTDSSADCKVRRKDKHQALEGLRNYTFRSTKLSSLDMYVKSITARTFSTIAHPVMMTWSFTTYRSL